MSTELIPAALEGERVDRVVSMLFGLPRREVAALVASGGVRLAGRAVAQRSARVREGEALDVDVPPSAGAPARPRPDPGVGVIVIHSDDDVVVVDKPSGLVVHPGAGRPAGTLVNGLLHLFPEMATVGDPARPGIVHRLDVGTSGLLVVARTEAAFDSLVAQLAGRSVERTYLALAWSDFDTTSCAVDAPVGRSPANRTQMGVVADGRPARTSFSVLERFRSPAPCTLLSCKLDTGRTHQVRVHLAAIGHPVVGDARYGGARPMLPSRRPFLHAHRLAFDHPATGRRVSFDSPLPLELVTVHDLLG
ncbi:MAG: RluA family pseudouridine synthase [Acidimicrobiales bacterium]